MTEDTHETETEMESKRPYRTIRRVYVPCVRALMIRVEQGLRDSSRDVEYQWATGSTRPAQTEPLPPIPLSDGPPTGFDCWD